MRVLIIANSLVGVQREKRKIVERIASHIAEKGGSADIAYIMKPGMGMKYSSRAALEGYDVVFSAGGDGTLNDVASGLVNRKTPLGVIPLGTGNGFARALRIPFEAEELIRMFDTGKTITIDAGRIASRSFFSVAGIGYDAYIAEDFNRRRSPRNTAKSLYVIAIKHYLLRRSERVTLVIDGREITRKLFGLTVCNTGQYGAGAIISPESSVRDGKLDAVIIPRFDVFRGLRAMFKLFDGTIHTMKGLEYLPFTSLTINRVRPGLCQVDGETFPAGKTVTVTIVPGALRVIVP
jgi:YegS/Rv2252/BmrU family lipid kinase